MTVAGAMCPQPGNRQANVLLAQSALEEAMQSLLAITILGLTGRELAIVAAVLIIAIAAIGWYAYSRRKRGAR